ncbi:MAG: 2'-5' RNA ligase family protein [bacterium]|nr:2'-5' RNA ligase family protein [bacterium]
MPDLSDNFNSTDLQADSQREYAVVILVPSQLERYVAPLRERFDPDYNLVAAHISLVFPFSTLMPVEDLSSIVAEEVTDLGPLRLRMGSIGDFYPRAPVIYWEVKQCDELNHLHKRLYARLDLPVPHREFVPHLTVAKEISTHRLVLVKDQIAAYLPDESFEVKAVDLIAPVAGHHWVSVRTFPINVEKKP